MYLVFYDAKIRTQGLSEKVSIIGSTRWGESPREVWKSYSPLKKKTSACMKYTHCKDHEIVLYLFLMMFTEYVFIV